MQKNCTYWGGVILQQPTTKQQKTTCKLQNRNMCIKFSFIQNLQNHAITDTIVVFIWQPKKVIIVIKFGWSSGVL